MSYIAVINILMVLSNTLQISFFYTIHDTLAQVIDENPTKLLNVLAHTSYLSTICST